MHKQQRLRAALLSAAGMEPLKINCLYSIQSVPFSPSDRRPYGP